VSGAPLLTAREVGARLGVSAETVLRWSRRGELPFVRFPGGAIRFREDGLDAWLDQRTVGAVPRGGVSQPRNRAQLEATPPVPWKASANPLRDGAAPNRGGSPDAC
jgi:excisionase family DNA binding protein